MGTLVDNFIGESLTNKKGQEKPRRYASSGHKSRRSRLCVFLLAQIPSEHTELTLSVSIRKAPRDITTQYRAHRSHNPL
jgi:hypothetical protein